MSALNEITNFLESRFEREILARVTLDAEAGSSVPLPQALDARLAEVLRAQGIGSLYAHQAEAFERISADVDTALLSRTASGKTLAFLLPLLNAYVRSEAPFSALLLYPTKALSRDQEGTLGRLLQSALGRRKLGVFDGDTPREDRRAIQRAADFVITNPDMLHAGILPNHHRGWKTFLARLRYIIVDEVHTYRGAFGSHVANVFRRLLRVCEMHGSRPVFVCSSATVGNPTEHLQALFQRSFHIIANDSAPRPRRDLYFINPPLLPEDVGGGRKGPGSVSVPLLRKAVELGVRTICFCRARQEVERLWRAVTDRHPELAARVQPYRGGLLPGERRQLEKDLFEGRLTAIITTNALELGIDIGDLDLCLLSGHPGTLAGFWQQAGRVGRQSARAAIVFIARNLPIDQYLAQHAEFVTRAPVEKAWLNADNPYIMLQHLPCAAYEHPLRAREERFDATVLTAAVEALRKEGALVPYRESLRYALEDYPARGVNLRGMTDYNIEIVHGSEVIGELDPIGARGTLYKDAIYQHLGRRYLSLDLDLEKKICRVEPVQVDYYTEAVWEKRLELAAPEDECALGGARLVFGPVHVNKQPKMYKKIRERSFENVGYGPITLPPFAYDTMGFTLSPPADWKQALDARDKRFAGAALSGLRYLLRHTAPVLCMADVADIETDVAAGEEQPQQWLSVLYLYDAHEGGVGYAEKIYESATAAFSFCRRVLQACPCSAGCRACVPPLPPGVTDRELEDFLVESDAARVCTRSLLEALLDGVIALPEVREIRRPRRPAVQPEPPDPEQERLRQRTTRAAAALRRKRERLH